MGDFVKPHAGLDFPAETEAEIITHRKIDCFTDSHPIVLEAKRLFATRSRRYAGILLDVFYDHLLAKKWEHFSAEPLDDFIARFYELLSRQALANALPPRLAQAVPYMVEQDWLGSYRDFVGVKLLLTASLPGYRVSPNCCAMGWPIWKSTTSNCRAVLTPFSQN
jgi:acyl carrier protein phosphodiesterase